MNAAVLGLLVASLGGGPASQSGLAGLGGLQLVHHKDVALLDVATHVSLEDDTHARVTLTYTLLAQAARRVEVSIHVLVWPTETDVAAALPPVSLLVLTQDGADVPLGHAVENPGRAQVTCGAAAVGAWGAPAVGHVYRGAVTLPARTPTRLVYAARVTLGHDDWLARNGVPTRSARWLCVQPAPLRGFSGTTVGRAVATVQATGGQVFTALPAGLDSGRWEQLGELRTHPPLVITLPAPARTAPGPGHAGGGM